MDISVVDATDPEILAELGARLRAIRRGQSLTIAEVSALADLNPETVSRAERGHNPTLQTVVRLLRAYNRLATLADFIPEPEVSPMALVRKAKRARGAQRGRAGGRGPGAGDEAGG
jgi:transcriptional regulator with XRE-family HTH domain